MRWIPRGGVHWGPAWGGGGSSLWPSHVNTGFSLLMRRRLAAVRTQRRVSNALSSRNGLISPIHNKSHKLPLLRKASLLIPVTRVLARPGSCSAWTRTRRSGTDVSKLHCSGAFSRVESSHVSCQVCLPASSVCSCQWGPASPPRLGQGQLSYFWL
jgi:hypothetical protein